MYRKAIAVVFCLTLVGCGGKLSPTPVSIGAIDSVFQIYTVNHLEIQGNDVRTRFSGGAMSLSPSHILLTDHQVYGSESDLRLQHHGDVHSTVLHSKQYQITGAHQEIYRFGWEIRTVNPPLDIRQQAELNMNPSLSCGLECLIPISEESYAKLNGIQGYSFNHHAIEGRVVCPDSDPLMNSTVVLPDSDDVFIVRLEGWVDLRGSSGFPVLITDNDGVGVSFAGVVLLMIQHESEPVTWIYAAKIPQL